MTAKKPAKKKPAAVKPQVDRSRTVASKDEDPSKTNESTGGTQVTDYEPSHPTLESADFDHQGAEEKRQAELAAQRDEHNRRTGDASR